jgi:putative ABC transport system permease protein
MALGADPRGILAIIMREALVLLAAGLVIGSGLAVLAGRAASSMLFGLKPSDPLVFAVAIGLLALVGLAASFLPAHRASRLDPMTALRDE